MKRNVCACLLIVCLCAVLAGCGGAAPAAPTAPTETETVSATETTTADPSFTLSVRAEGSGSIAYAEPDGELTFSEKYPTRGTQIRLESPVTYLLGAQADKGFKFVQWNKDGKKYAVEDKITVTVKEAAEYVAVFAAE